MAPEAMMWDVSHAMSTDESSKKTFLQRRIEQAIEEGPEARDFYDRLVQLQTGTKGKPIYDIVRGKSKKPAIATIQAIAKAFHRPVSFFTEEEERDRSWLPIARRRRGWSTTKLAQEANAVAYRDGLPKVPNGAIEQFEAGKGVDDPAWLETARRAIEEGSQPKDHEFEARDELVYIREVDIRYAMGDGANPLEYPDAKLVPFNLGFIRGLTRAPTDRLFIATGIGSSMEPILQKHDLVLIDTSDTKIAIGDTAWALEYAGSGYIKFLRPVMRDGVRKIVMLSANPEYPPEEIDPADLRVVGKVALIIRRQ